LCRVAARRALSPGEVVNAAGQVIGLTTAAVTGQSDFTAENVNFAIPTDTAIAVLRQLGLAVGDP
jgi:S1-C subfamily serine protease